MSKNTTETKKARINSTIDKKLEKKFRIRVYERFGMVKGNIQKGLEEAIKDWITKIPEKESTEN